MSELDDSDWQRFDKRPMVVQHTGLILKWIHMNAKSCVDSLQHTDVLALLCRYMHAYTSCTYVSLCLSLRWSTFFSSSVCQSVRPSVCISPSWQPACLHFSPPFTVLFAAKWLLSRSVFRIFLPAKNTHNSECVLSIPCWMEAFVLRMLEAEEILPEIEMSARMAELLIRTFPLMGLHLSYEM